MARITRPSFRYRADYVAVRPIRLSASTVIQPGEELSKYHVRMHQKISLWQRRRIGVKGCPWTEYMLLHSGDTYARPEVAAKVCPTTDQHPPAAEPVTSIEADNSASAINETEDDAAAGVNVRKIANRKWTVDDPQGGELIFTSKKAALAHLAENAERHASVA